MRKNSKNLSSRYHKVCANRNRVNSNIKSNQRTYVNNAKRMEDLVSRYKEVKQRSNERNKNNNILNKIFNINELPQQTVSLITGILVALFIIIFLGENIINLLTQGIELLPIIIAVVVVFYIKNNIKFKFISKFIKNIYSFGIKKK